MADETNAPMTTTHNDGLIAQPPLKDGPAMPMRGHGDEHATAADAAETAASATQSLKDGASKIARQATDRARDYVSEGKARAGTALDDVSRMMSEAATTVDEKLGPQYGQYARTAADGIASFSESLKGKEIEDLVADAQGFVRKSPAVAIGIAAALGFVMARLVKAGLDAADGIADGDVAAAPKSGPKSETAAGDAPSTNA